MEGCSASQTTQIYLYPHLRRESNQSEIIIYMAIHYWTPLGIRLIDNWGITRIASNSIIVMEPYCFFLATFSSRRIATLEMSPHRFDITNPSLWKQRRTNSKARSP